MQCDSYMLALLVALAYFEYANAFLNVKKQTYTSKTNVTVTPLIFPTL